MFTFRRPSPEALRRVIEAQANAVLTYQSVGATNGQAEIPADFILDHTRVELGQRAATFERAKAALASWQQFDLGWLSAFPVDTPLKKDATVLVVARAGGLWWINAARIVYTIDEQNEAGSRFGFAYGTLPAHVETGEERFLIEWDHKTDVVSFDIRAFSRPRHFLIRRLKKRARAMQKRFGAEACAAMQRAVKSED